MRVDGSPKRIAAAVVVMLWLISAGAARGASEIVPELSIMAESNDNPRLVADAPELALPGDDAATRLLADVSLLYRGYDERGEFTLQPRLRSDMYKDSSDQDLESTDVFLRSSGEHRGERRSVGFDLDLARERILGAEFLAVQPLDIDVEDPTLVDTVLVGQNERRTRIALSPRAAFAASEQGSVRLRSRLMDVRYTGDPLSSRTDFQDALLGVEYARNLNERSVLSGGVFGSRYEADANRNETDTVGVEIGFSRTLSESWSWSIAGGMERSEFEYVTETADTVSGTDDHFTVGLGLRKRTELSSLNLDLRRRADPDSFGFIAARDEFRLTLFRRLSPELTGSFGLRVIESESVGSIADQDQSYGSIAFDIDWAFAELWSLMVGYRHLSWGFGTAQRDADSNSFAVGFTYRGRSRASGL
jgi:hypothetical protein